jgi:hypothetical protein
MISVLLNEFLSQTCSNVTTMRHLLSAMVALLVLHSVDEQFNRSRYTQAAISMIAEMAKPFG